MHTADDRVISPFSSMVIDLVPTFRSSYYTSARIFNELRKVKGTSKSMILVPVFYLKFLE